MLRRNKASKTFHKLSLEIEIILRLTYFVYSHLEWETVNDPDLANSRVAP